MAHLDAVDPGWRQRAARERIEVTRRDSEARETAEQKEAERWREEQPLEVAARARTREIIGELVEVGSPGAVERTAMRHVRRWLGSNTRKVALAPAWPIANLTWERRPVGDHPPTIGLDTGLTAEFRFVPMDEPAPRELSERGLLRLAGDVYISRPVDPPPRQPGEVRHIKSFTRWDIGPSYMAYNGPARFGTTVFSWRLVALRMEDHLRTAH